MAPPETQVDRVTLHCYIAGSVPQPRLNFARGEPFHGIIRRYRP